LLYNETKEPAFKMVKTIILLILYLTKRQFVRYEEILAKEEGGEQPKKKEEPVQEDEENYDDFDWDAFEKEDV
jgi:hypothetical protein